MKKDVKIIIPEYVKSLLQRLCAAGFEAFCVGGCVRDSLLGLTPSDWDIATSALPDETASLFHDMRVIETGKKHGTLMIISNQMPVEITTFRVDGDYPDARHPASVNFTENLDNDLSRRDFTMNAIAYNIERGLVDLFGGREDIERGIIRAVGNAETRFSEDALRTLRCCRFAAQLGFEVDADTLAAAVSKKDLLGKISKERICTEFSKLLQGHHAESALRSTAEIIFTVLPELAPMEGCTQENPYHIYDVWEHTLHAISHAPNDLIARYAVFLHDCGKPSVKTYDEGTAHFYGHAVASAAIANDLLNKLRLPTKTKNRIVKLVRLHDQPLPMSDRRIKKLLVELQPEDFTRLLDIIKADISAQAPTVISERLEMLEAVRTRAAEIIQSKMPLSLKDLAIDGEDLLSLGYIGEEIGVELKKLFETAVNDISLNTKERLIKIAARHKK